MSEDVPIKSLLKSFPKESLELFIPGLIQSKGKPPQSCEDVTSEILALDLSKKGGFLDVALKFKWEDGFEAILLLIEHWSEIRKISYRRLNRYVGELLVRHPDALVKPVLLITDPKKDAHVDGCFEYSIEGETVLTLRCTVFRTDHHWLSKVREWKNPVGAVLWVLEPGCDPVSRSMEALDLLVTLGFGADIDCMAQLLAQVQKLSRMTQVQSNELLIRLRETPKMTTVVDMLRAEGKAEGKAEGEVLLLKYLVEKGKMTEAEAKNELIQMADEGRLDQAELAMALRLLAK